MRKFLALVLALTLALVPAHPVLASDTRFGDIVIQSPWSRATPSGAKNGAVFLSIRNEGAEPDRLIGVDSAVASTVSLHGYEMNNDIMRMDHVQAIDLPAGAEVMLKPHSFHVMLMGLQRPLIENESFPLTLVFERAGSVTVEVKIGKAGAMMP
jgi:periplasmic copper chaperone A